MVLSSRKSRLLSEEVEVSKEPLNPDEALRKLNTILRESNPKKRGHLFEDFVADVFCRGRVRSCIKGLKYRGKSGDLDLVIDHEEHDLILIESKSFSKNVGSNALDQLKDHASLYGAVLKYAILAITTRLTDKAREKFRDLNRESNKGLTYLIIDIDDWYTLFELLKTDKKACSDPLDFFIKFFRRILPKKYYQ